MNKKNTPWIIDRFDDTKILRYEVPAFEELDLEQKKMIYFLGEAAKCGRDILFDQNFKYNLTIRRTLEALFENYKGDRESTDWINFEKYLKHIWFANGIHHHYSNDKFVAEFSTDFFAEAVRSISTELLLSEFGKVDELLELISPIIFDPKLYPSKITRRAGADVVSESVTNFYSNLTEAEVEEFYGEREDPQDPTPISWGMNSQLVKDANGEIHERIWQLGGVYSEAIEQIIYWLGKAHGVANDIQKDIINTLIAFYTTGDLKIFDEYSIKWVGDTESKLDFVNGFIEVYGDPLGRKATWESVVNFRNEEASRRTKIIADNAQWFEDHAPINPTYRKPQVKGVSAKVITVAMLGGDCYPSTPIGINLPNADWIRSVHGSKSVTIDNITYAYDKAAHGDGFAEEFVLRAEDRARMAEYGKRADDLHTDLHECLGHGSGRLAEGVLGGELKSYGSVLEEARADLFGLYYIGDPKMIELGLIPNLDMARAQYAKYIMNGAMTQLARIELGRDVEQAHMRNRKIVAEWCLERGKEDNSVAWVIENEKRYVVVNDFDRLHELFGELLCEVQRIKSEGDYEAAQILVEKYGVKIDFELHKEVIQRYKALGIEPYNGFVNPEYRVVEQDGEIVDIEVVCIGNYAEQMMHYSKRYSFLPNIN
ncbi:MAG: dihydrofolate reductase [Rikenellaceae bacterium]